MFGLSTELITKGKLATVKRFALTKGSRSKRLHLNLFRLPNYVINYVDKTKHLFPLPTDAAPQFP